MNERDGIDRDGTVAHQLLQRGARQPPLLDTGVVLAAGRRRLRARRVVPAVALTAVLASGAGIAVRVDPRGARTPSTVTVDSVPGGWVPVKIGKLTVGVAVRRLGPDLFLHVGLPDGSGGWKDLGGSGTIQGQDPAYGMATGALPGIGFAVLPAGSHDIRAVYPTPVRYQLVAVTATGEDSVQHVVVVIDAPSDVDSSLLKGFTWLDARQQPQEYPYAP